jgi:hypothetical protein
MRATTACSAAFQGRHRGARSVDAELVQQEPDQDGVRRRQRVHRRDADRAAEPLAARRRSRSTGLSLTKIIGICPVERFAGRLHLICVQPQKRGGANGRRTAKRVVSSLRRPPLTAPSPWRLAQWATSSVRPRGRLCAALRQARTARHCHRHPARPRPACRRQHRTPAAS